MADKLAFELVSPDRLLLSVEADAVAMPGMEGDFGVLPGHAPVISALRAGVIEVEGGGDGPDRVFIAGGFAEVAADRLTVLAEDAIPVADMDRADLEQRVQDAREDLEDAEDDEQRRLAEGKLALLQEMLAAVR
ncbi:MAG: F0F1 ATP synthase subunit epsilon [Alphaproteobacteria bacterium]|jgi:F-type H+-transporting ATPase subunit epsilon|nr:F0F1 ATP synthase subunit epsilon [Alphaproteobacteria bacterium]MDP6565547.1 F0F1 ATP synthase subunit epsilon [Alphaproteobacteria bacterium]MDP6812086.1 F0F1 ATP synthase subunit epsilon [Alphaproteobacteria bacterium]